MQNIVSLAALQSHCVVLCVCFLYIFGYHQQLVTLQATNEQLVNALQSAPPLLLTSCLLVAWSVTNCCW